MKVDYSVIGSAIYDNAYEVITPWIKSIGFHTNQMNYRENALLSSVAENYLINSMHTRSDTKSIYSISHYLGDTGVTMISLNGRSDFSGFKTVSLPRGAPLNLALGEALVRRRSTRKFTGDSINLENLATILRAGSGVSAKEKSRLRSGGEVTFSFRTYSSAGGLYPVNLYIAVFNIDKLENGIYQYYPANDILVKLVDELGCEKLLESTEITEEMISLKKSNAILLLSMRPWKSMRKYGERGLRFSFHETGAISQNVNLAVTALGLGSVDCSSFYEDEVNELLGVDGITESFTHTIVIGVPA